MMCFLEKILITTNWISMLLGTHNNRKLIRAMTHSLIFGGENSDMSNYARTDAIPTPIPPIILATIKKINESGIVHPKAEIKGMQQLVQ